MLELSRFSQIYANIYITMSPVIFCVCAFILESWRQSCDIQERSHSSDNTKAAGPQTVAPSV